MIDGIYLKIDRVVGGSVAQHYEGAIDIASFAWGASNPGTALGGVGRAVISPLTVSTKTDTATAPLLRNLISGQLFSTMTLTVVFDSGELDTYKFNNVMVNGVDISGEDNSDVSYSFTFRKLAFQISGKTIEYDMSHNTVV